MQMPPSNIFIPGMTLRREFGIEPDIHAQLTAEDTEKGIDTIIERAKTWILTRQ